MKRIAIIEGYIRDAQIFAANPKIIGEDDNWEDNYVDLSNPCQYIGIFEGYNEESIAKAAAETEGVHPDVITLIDPDAALYIACS